MRRADEIVGVDGATMAGLGLSRVGELLREAGAKRRLLVRRGFERREVRLRLRALAWVRSDLRKRCCD